jgi:hypothetical protein
MTGPVPSNASEEIPTNSHHAVSIADCRIRCDSVEKSIRLSVESHLSGFTHGSDDSHSDVSLLVSTQDLGAYPVEAAVFDSGHVWKFNSNRGDYVFRLETPLHPSRPYRIARFDSGVTEGEVLLEKSLIDPALPVCPLEHPLDQLVVSAYLSTGKGVALHSCGLAASPLNGLLFLGQSGAGKTTTARLWAQCSDVQVLCDERCIVRRLDGAFWVYGTPWHGDGGFAMNQRAPLTHIFFLKQAKSNEVVPLRRIDAAARLFACSFPPFYSPTGLDFTLAFFDEIVSSLPCYELRFTADRSAVDLIRIML